jgi:hypothetical protein
MFHATDHRGLSVAFHIFTGNPIMVEAMNRQTQTVETQEARDHAEGRISRAIENQSAKIPSDVWLWVAIGTMGVSLLLKIRSRKEDSLFVGQWAAPLLLMGVYNKLVKVAGSDRIAR